MSIIAYALGEQMDEGLVELLTEKMTMILESGPSKG